MYRATPSGALPASPGLRPQSRSENAGLNLGRLDFLIIEKNPLMQQALARVLKVLGVRYLRMTGDVRAAFHAFRDNPADIVLSDWAPGLDTLELLRLIRNHPGSPDPYVPFILVSAFTELHQVHKARDRGTTDFLARPFTVPGLYGRIRAAVQRQDRFVRAASYFGPDRRRRARPFPWTDRRGQMPGAVHVDEWSALA